DRPGPASTCAAPGPRPRARFVGFRPPGSGPLPFPDAGLPGDAVLSRPDPNEPCAGPGTAPDGVSAGPRPPSGKRCPGLRRPGSAGGQAAAPLRGSEVLRGERGGGGSPGGAEEPDRPGAGPVPLRIGRRGGGGELIGAVTVDVQHPQPGPGDLAVGVVERAVRVGPGRRLRAGVLRA